MLCVPTGGNAADPQPYTVDVAKTGNGPLDAAIHDSLTLISLQKVAPVGAFALVGRARIDRDRVIAALHSYGFYKARVTMTIAGQPIDDPTLPETLDAVPADHAVPVTIAITAGPQFHLGQVSVIGPLPPEARAQLGLQPGQPALAEQVVDARTRLSAALANEGYALAKVSEPVAILHPGTDQLDVSFTVDTGPRVDIGPIAINGLKGVNESFVRRRLLLHQGEQFSPTTLERARSDLSDTGVFSSVRIVPATRLDVQGRLPVEIDVTERPEHVVKLTAAYSTDLGVSLGASWSDRNLFGNAEQLNIGGYYTGGGTDETAPGYNVYIQFIKPDFPARNQSVQLDAGAIDENLTAYDRTAVTGDALFNVKFNKQWSGSIGVAGEDEKIYQELVNRYYTLIGLPISLHYDSTNNLLEPTQGIRATVNATPTLSVGHDNATFVTMQASASTYLDASGLLGEAPGRSVVALRGLVGETAGASQFEVPADKRFYAGGSGTVRGYKYQQVGPLFPDTKPEGGTAVSAGTIEFRQRVLESFGVAAFVDAGQVSASGAPFTENWAVGAGVGFRYYTSIGPIRLDVALPLQHVPGNDAFEVYIGIGEAF
ncbi:MAG TPA: BamA/TamA family outer membrane protein [Acidisphaera sp.]|nr:BamA/TamA family outer membrane protein [Acidisphaera sp.]